MLRVIDIIYFCKIVTFIGISPLFLLVLFVLDSISSDANIPALFCYHLLISSICSYSKCSCHLVLNTCV